jgi:hypothetical protein
MGYALLEKGAKYAEWKDACRALNRIHLTESDAEEGIHLIRFEREKQDEIKRFLARFQDIKPELVIASLQARFYLLMDAEENCMDLKKNQPSVYASMLTGPLFPEDFGVFR